MQSTAVIEGASPLNWYVIQISNHDLFRPKKGCFGQLAQQCASLGAEIYVPIEREMLVMRKTKKRIVKIKALIPGYGFIRNVNDFAAIEDLKGIQAIMRHGPGLGPLIVKEREIERLREAEAQIYDEYEAKQQRKRVAESTSTKKDRNNAFPVNSPFTVKDSHFLAGRVGKIEKHTGRQTVKAMIDFLGKATMVEFDVNDLEIDVVGKPEKAA